jgi:hypothetical protein
MKLAETPAVEVCVLGKSDTGPSPTWVDAAKWLRRDVKVSTVQPAITAWQITATTECGVNAAISLSISILCQARCTNARSASRLFRSPLRTSFRFPLNHFWVRNSGRRTSLWIDQVPPRWWRWHWSIINCVQRTHG